jgi:formylglycine-generating enzyme required for sulfatase activity
VVKIQDARVGKIEKQGHEAAARVVPPEFMPALIEHVDDESTGLSVTVYEIAGASIFGIQPLSYYIDQQAASAEVIIAQGSDFLTALSPLRSHLQDRRRLLAFDLCNQVVNAGKNRLDGKEGLAGRLDNILPGVTSSSSLNFDDIPETFPNPIAYAYDESLWKEQPVIAPWGPTHGDYHSDNLLWSESDKRLTIIDWATFSEMAPAFVDFALLEIDIVHRSIDCGDKRRWAEWNNISSFLSSGIIPEPGAPNGYLAVQLWRLIQPLRVALHKQIADAGHELSEMFSVAYFLILYATTLPLIRNQFILTDRKIGLLLLAARYLTRALKGFAIDWQSKRPFLVPSAYEIGLRAQSSRPDRDEELKYITARLKEWYESSRYYVPIGGDSGLSRRRVQMDPFYELLDQREDELSSGLPRGNYHITDVLQELLVRRRVALLGEPGAGKSFTLQQLAYLLASEAKQNPSMPIPVLVPLGGYTSNVSLFDFVEQSASGLLGHHGGGLRSLAADDRLAFLLDGVNEIGEASKEYGYGEITKLAKEFPKVILVITCRTLEYPRVISLDRITIRPLNSLQIKAFLESYLGSESGDELFWLLVDRDKQAKKHYWPRFEAGGGNEKDFWLASEQPNGLRDPWYSWDWEFWLKLRDNPRSYLALARNPYMLSMIAGTYDVRHLLPTNRGALFKLFVDSLMTREQNRMGGSVWIDEELQYVAFSRLAYAMQRDHLGTSVDRSYAVKQMVLPGMLDLAQKESIVERISGKIAFTHQLLQEFFAAYGLDRERVEGKVSATDIWPPTEWWRPVGFEETSVILAGTYRENPLSVLEWLRDAQPELAARCVVDGGIEISPDFRQLLIAAWLPRLTDTKEPVLARAAIGRALGLIRGDIRPGVMYLDDKTGLPRFEWIHVPAGGFTMGTGDRSRLVQIDAFRVSKYLVTNAQYSAFVRDGGYSSEWKECWTETGWYRKGGATGPTDYSETLVLPNHPRIGVNWYEAVAFCRWLDKRLRERGEIPAGQQVRLPTEAEWEKLARGTDGRVYPWGGTFSSELCNVTGIESTTAVGIFPNGVSPYGVCDVIGNSWKWCLTKWNGDELAIENNAIEGADPRCYRGASWGSNQWRTEPWSSSEVECHRRYGIVPEDDRPDAIGFFVLIGKQLY